MDDELRYRLIRALIETIKTFKKIGPVKIIISLRSDLLLKVFEKTRDSGFQEEKYDDLMLSIKWQKDELKELLDKRISFLLADMYTNSSPNFSTIFTSKPNGERAIDYILDRTFMRPRDAISFVNLCLDNAYGKGEIKTQIIKEAETVYSKKRFNALCHEWYSTYPLLKDIVVLIKNKKNGFKHSDILDKDIDELALSLSVLEGYDDDPIKKIAVRMFEKNGPSRAVLRNNVMAVLYAVGILGAKKSSYTSVSWSQNDEPFISESEVKNSTFFEVHPMLQGSS